MCSNVLSNYATFLNAGSEPTLLTFQLKNCKGLLTPSTDNGNGFTSNTYTKGETIVLTNGMKSMYIPVSITQVEVTSATGLKSTLYGPYVSGNTDGLVWDTSSESKTWLDDNPVSVKIVDIQNWNMLIRQQCLGRVVQVNGYDLLRYQGQTNTCDTFMTNYCALHVNSPECGCFLAQKSHTLKSTGVACVSQDCVGQRTYKTKAMLERPCNQTLCQQIIKTDPNNENLIQVNNKIYCNSNYFDKDTQEVSKDSNQATNEVGEVQNTSSETNTTHTQNLKVTSKPTPWYTWIIIGISCVLFIILTTLIYKDVL